MRTVKYLLYIVFFFLIICCVISCIEEKVSESLQILIQNRTDDSIHIKLYPKDDAGANLYLHSDKGSGYALTKYS